MNKIIIIGLCIFMLLPIVSADENHRNYVWNSTDWVPWLSTSDGKPKVDLNLLNITAGSINVTGNGYISGIFNIIGALTSATLDTGQGANELYDMDQNVLTTSDVMFNDLNATGTMYLNDDKCSSGDFLTSDATSGDVSCDTPSSTQFGDRLHYLDIDNFYNNTQTDSVWSWLNATYAFDDDLDTFGSCYFDGLTITVCDLTLSYLHEEYSNKSQVILQAKIDNGSIINYTIDSKCLDDDNITIHAYANGMLGFPPRFYCEDADGGCSDYGTWCDVGAWHTGGTTRFKLYEVDIKEAFNSYNITKSIDIDGWLFSEYAYIENNLTTGTVNTGQGDNELYDMDQNVLTTSDVTFKNITATGTIQGSLNSYDTGWISRSDWTDVNLGSITTKNVDSAANHNMDLPLSDILVKVLVSSDGTNDNSFEVSYHDNDDGLINYFAGLTIYQTDSNNISVQTGYSGISYHGTNGVRNIVDTEDWYYKVKVWRLG